MNTSSSNLASTLKPTAPDTNDAAAAAPPDARSARTTPPPLATVHLPDEPLVTIQPSKSWNSLNLRDLWLYRELFYFLTWRDLKVRYKQTVLGILWVVLQPLMVTLIFTVFLGILVRVPSDGIPYPIFVYAGILPWTFFSSAIASSGNSLVSNANLITKVYFPRLIVPIAAIGGRLVDFAIAFVILIGLLIYYRVSLTLNIFMLLPLILLTTVLALGCGMLISALNVKYRDVSIALPVLIQLWMYVSPVLYPSKLVAGMWPSLYYIYSLNPLVGIIDGFRTSLFGGEFNWFAIGVATALALVLLVYSAYQFRRVEKSFADII